MHAEDIGWPPKKTGKTINANNSNIFAEARAQEEALLAAAAA
ncbi:hypothetical protein PRO82_001044 [Candidatus Protochlamydia amoebophila]|nr:hypothetical protein [Candidatus Protochlamydia amoebophila]